MAVESLTLPEPVNQSRKKKCRCFIPAALVVILLIIALVAWYLYHHHRPDPEIYYAEYFTEGMTGWQGLDATWLAHEGTEEGVVKLARQQFAAPHLMHYLPLGQSPPENFVWRFRVRVNSFADEAMTMGTLFLPHGPLTMVVNAEGRLGLAHHLFAPPIYSTALMSRLTFGAWHDLYVHVNHQEKQVVFYLNTRRVLTQTWEQPTFPVQEIWLGALWLKGGGTYGAPLNVSYSLVELGNEGLLPRPSFLEFLLECLLKLCDLCLDKIRR